MPDYKFKSFNKECKYIKSLTNTLELKYHNLYHNKSKLYVASNLRIAISNIILNLLYQLKCNSPRSIIYLNSNHYSKSIYNGKMKNGISYYYTKSILDMLIDLDYIVLDKGKRSYSEVCKSYIYINDQFKDLLRPYQYNIKFDKNNNVILLRDLNRKNVTYRMTSDLKKNRDNIDNYNKLLLNTNLSLNGEKLHYVQFVRIYNNDFEHGGRFYEQHGLIQCASSSKRSTLLINENPTIEVDFKSLHPSIFYSYLNVKTQDDFDPYFIDPVELNLFDTPKMRKQLRSLAKLGLLIIINSKNAMKSNLALKNKLDEDRTKDFDEQKFDLIPLDFDVKLIIKRIKKNNPKLKSFFNCSAGSVLQNADSEIAAIVINHFVKKSVALIPIHDSFIIEKQYENELIEVMKQAYREIVPNNLNCRIEVK